MKKQVGVFLYIVCLVGFHPKAFADWGALFHLGYSSDAFKTASTATGGFMHYGAVLMLGLDKKGAYFLGYHYGSNSFSANDGTTTTTFTTTDLGPFFAFYFNRARTVGMTIGYNLQSTAKYNDGSGTPLEWQGTSLHAGIGFEQELSEGIWLGAKLMMYSMSYNRDVTLGATNTTIANTRQWINPILSLSFR